MNLPGREWFSVDDLARRWGVTTSDILHYIETYRLCPAFRMKPFECNERVKDANGEWLEWREATYVCGGGICALPDVRFLTVCDYNGIGTDGRINLNGIPLYWPRQPDTWFMPIKRAVVVTVNDIVILAEEVKRIENEQTETTGKDPLKRKPPKPAKIRVNAFDKILEKIREDFFEVNNRYPTWFEVKNALKKLAKDDHCTVIQSVTSKIIWHDGKRERTPVTDRGLQNRLIKFNRTKKDSELTTKP